MGLKHLRGLCCGQVVEVMFTRGIFVLSLCLFGCYSLGSVYGINKVLRRGGDGLQRGRYRVFIVHLNVNQKPAWFSWLCS